MMLLGSHFIDKRSFLINQDYLFLPLILFTDFEVNSVCLSKCGFFVKSAGD